ncbi:class I SAM-dependent rRNA methyltransferase [Exiguobacterium oxidotolerans]|uniref:class I SAM-dependent rRNA methyltransferase n=1 Tax=Exiguobacterium oxidotolerans TaxID=223958 RepID=UPI00049430EC|nr:class I SAM-dependent rRNA methyltransferase [Exiguobacterium oxidotolerans]
MPREIYPVVVKATAVEQIKNGQPLLYKELFQKSNHLKEAGALLRLTTEDKEYLATGYFGKQEKGLGWLLSTDEIQEIDDVFFKEKIETALDQRDAFFENELIDTFRVFNGSGDGIGGLTIDCFDHHYLITFENEGIYSFKQEIVSALESLIHFKSIYEKRAFQIDGQPVKGDDFLAGERGDFPEVLEENSLPLLYHLDAGMRTGLDINQRDLRTIVKQHATGRTVLNLFSDTGTLTAAALLGGALETTSVDFSTRSRNKTIEQLELHQLDPAAQTILVQDAFDYIDQADKKTRFDFVIVHPPALVKTQARHFRAEVDLPALIQQTIHMTHRGGLLLITTDCQLFDQQRFMKMVEQAFKKLRQTYEIVWEISSLEDFPEHPSLKEAERKAVLVRRK